MNKTDRTTRGRDSLTDNSADTLTTLLESWSSSKHTRHTNNYLSPINQWFDRQNDGV